MLRPFPFQIRRQFAFRGGLLLCGFFVLAQAAPAHAAMLNVTQGLQLWLDATDSSTLTTVGSSVTEWRDKSGNGYIASAISDGKRPTYNATGFNGQPSIAFNRDQLRVDGGLSTITAANPDRTVFLVFDRTSANNSSMEIFGTFTHNMIDVGTSFYPQRVRVRDVVSNGTTGGADGGGGFVSAPGSLPLGPRILTVFAGSGGSTQVLVDGESILDTSDSYAHYPLNADLGIGGALFNGREYIGLLSEVLVYDRVLSYEELQSVGVYLETKYALDTAFKTPEPATVTLTALIALALIPLYRRRK